MQTSANKQQNTALPREPIPHFMEDVMRHLIYYAAACHLVPRAELTKAAHICNLGLPPKETISKFERWFVSRAMGSPNLDHLLVVVKFNVFRALISNSETLGFAITETIDDDALSPFAETCNTLSSQIQRLPLALHPTRLQCEIPHHPWIDLLPAPKMRDNVISAGVAFDDMEESFCGDLIGFHNTPNENTGMIIWGEPYDISKWEVTEGFCSAGGGPSKVARISLNPQTAGALVVTRTLWILLYCASTGLVYDVKLSAEQGS